MRPWIPSGIVFFWRLWASNQKPIWRQTNSGPLSPCLYVGAPTKERAPSRAVKTMWELETNILRRKYHHVPTKYTCAPTEEDPNTYQLGRGHQSIALERTGQGKAGFTLVSWCEVSQHYLKSTALVVLRVDPGSKSQLRDKNLGCLGEEHRGFCTDHLEEIVGPHCQSPEKTFKPVSLLCQYLPWDKSWKKKRWWPLESPEWNKSLSRGKTGNRKKGRGEGCSLI